MGYRKALSWIHASHGRIGVEPDSLLRLHALCQGGTAGDAGVWKRSPNEIVEIGADGRRRVRFVPVDPAGTPAAIAEMCLGYRHALTAGVPPLLASACLVLDFLCVHPFSDGSGRVSRLLMLLAAYHHGYEVGRYVSFERIVEQMKQDYYDVLQASSSRWHEGRHDVTPWFSYQLSILRMAYREFEERAGRHRPPRGSKTDLVVYALESMTGPFGIADVERLCPNVSRDMIRSVMNRWRKEGKLVLVKLGRDARWEGVSGAEGRRRRKQGVPR